MHQTNRRIGIVLAATWLPVVLGTSLSAVADTTQDTQSAGVLQEIVVSAQKREQRLQDVPVPVTSIDANSLVANDQLRIQDYYTNVPGLNLASHGNGDASLSIRGITTGTGSNPTVGVNIDDVPIGSTTALGTNTFAPDIDPSDLQRIEVLRGPQGTLYGASSIGGILKFVTVDPSTQEVSGRVESDVNSVYNGNGVGYGFRAAVNVPLGDTVAVRVSGFDRHDPGYIDDPALNIDGVNQVDVSGGRVSALWHPTAALSLKLSALIQNTTGGGTADSTPKSGLDDLQQLRAFSGAGAYHHNFNLYTANLAADLGDVKLVSITGYGVDKYDSAVDLTKSFGPIASLVYGINDAELHQHNVTYKLTQEMRLAGTLLQRVDWLVGAFYTHEDTPTHDVYYALDPATLTNAGLLLSDPYPTTYAEYAAFTDLTFHITDRIDVQLGGRESHNSQTYAEALVGPADPIIFGAPSPVINPLVHTNDNSFTYLVTPSFKIAPDLMLYARLASGYRPGGPNPTCTLFGYPCHYNPDTTRNYEVGFKGEAWDHKVSVDVSIYYIDWKDIQLQVNQPSTGAVYYSNGSRAKSQGVELAVKTRPMTGLTIAGWIALNDVKLTADLPANSAAIGFAGDALPYSSRFSGNVSIDEELPFTSSTSGFVGDTLSYMGDRQSEFSPSPAQPRVSLHSYAQDNFRLGVRHDLWRVNLFVNNVANQRGVLSFVYNQPNRITYDQPRTVGLAVSKTF